MMKLGKKTHLNWFVFILTETVKLVLFLCLFTFCLFVLLSVCQFVFCLSPKLNTRETGLFLAKMENCR